MGENDKYTALRKLINPPPSENSQLAENNEYTALRKRPKWLKIINLPPSISAKLAENDKSTEPKMAKNDPKQ